MSRFKAILQALLPILIAAVELALVRRGGPTAATIPVGLVEALFLTGYVWSRALVTRPTAPLAQLLVAFTVSLGILMVAGLLLNVLTSGLTARNWSEALLAVVVAGVFVGAARGAYWGSFHFSSAHFRVRPAAVLKALAALICVVAAGVISISSQNWENASEHFTILGVTGALTQTPVVTVTNHEGRSMNYVDTVYVDGKKSSSHAFALVSDQLAHQYLAPLIQSAAKGAEIKIVLTRAGSSTPYRDVWFRSAR